MRLLRLRPLFIFAIILLFSIPAAYSATKTRDLDASKRDKTDLASHQLGSQYELGIALYLKENFTGAVDAFETHLEDNPDHQASREWIGLIEALGPMHSSSAPMLAKAAPSPAPSLAPRCGNQGCSSKIRIKEVSR